ncbi:MULTISPECIES: hypothetical protein [Roseobacteraceae]|nr:MULTISPECIES: hypothetical protein [Roseobacteraceae]
MIDNLSDKPYATCLSRSNTFDTSVEKVNEPGRNVYVAVQMQF